MYVYGILLKSVEVKFRFGRFVGLVSVRSLVLASNLNGIGAASG